MLLLPEVIVTARVRILYSRGVIMNANSSRSDSVQLAAKRRWQRLSSFLDECEKKIPPKKLKLAREGYARLGCLLPGEERFQ